MIYIGSDHRGFELKNKLKDFLVANSYKVEDSGPSVYDPNDDFVDFANIVADAVGKDDEARGILICRNGVGMDVAANKHKNIRASLGFDPEQVRLARNDDNINVLSLASDFLNIDIIQKIVKTFLETPFEGHERQLRRLNKIADLE